MYFGYKNRISIRRFVLLFGDVLVILVSTLASAIMRLGFLGAMDYISVNALSLLGSGAIFLVVFFAGGMYDRNVVTRKGESFRLSLVLTIISLVIIIASYYARFEWHIGRGILLSAGIFIFFGCWLIRRVFRLALGYGLFSKNCLLLAEELEGSHVLDLLRNSPDAGYTIFGVVTTDGSDASNQRFFQDLPILGSVGSLKSYVNAYDIETIIVATSRVREPAILQILRPLRYAGVEILDYIGLCEEFAQKIPLDHIDDEWLMNAAMNNSRIHVRQIKRILDIVASVCGIVLLMPISLLAMLAVKVSSKGPIFYRQVRVGLGGNKYTLYKFRSMRQDAEKHSGAVWSTVRDARITRVGRFCRKWRVDEIPQLFNVLQGDMSLVGPRPERPEFIKALEESIPFFRERLLVRPGITGWAQVKYPYTSTIDGVRTKLQYDLFYIKNMGFFFDVLILLRTFKTIIVGLRYADEVDEVLKQEQDEEEIAATKL